MALKYEKISSQKEMNLLDRIKKKIFGSKLKGAWK
jgi:hypothetical protein